MDSNSAEWRAGPSIPTVCRCCLAEGCYKDISTEYFWMGKREVYAEMLTETFDISIAYSHSGGPNSQSRLICEPCISRLRDASEFKRQVQECEKTFLQHLDPGRDMSLDAPTEIVTKEVKIEAVKLEKSISDDDDNFDDHMGFGDDDDDDLDDQPLTRLATKTPKKESVDILDLLDNAKAAEKRKCTIKLKSTPAKKVKKDGRLAPKATTSKQQPKPEAKKKGYITLKWIPKKQYSDHRHNAGIILECSNACPFRWQRGGFTCAYCSIDFGEFTELKQHSFLEHPNKIEALRSSRGINYIKVDVTSLRCELCLKPSDDLDSLVEHLMLVHKKPIVKEFGIGVTPFLLDAKDGKLMCTHCDETFEFFTKLNMHINEHYPNNICPQCGKAFSTIHRLKAHLDIHETAANSIKYPCTKCDQIFLTKNSRNSHSARVHGPEFRYRCPYCKNSFKSYSDRIKHFKAEHNKNVEFPCHLCTAVFALCNQRTKHIQQVHVKVKPFLCSMCPYQFPTAAQLKCHMIRHGGERKYQCNVCKKAYARKKTLREHMRIHNNDKRFVCEFCNNAYVQKCSLQSHMRTHHPNAEMLKKIKRDL